MHRVLVFVGVFLVSSLAPCQQEVTQHQVDKIRRLVGYEFYACLESGLRYPVEYDPAAANGVLVPKYKVPVNGKLVVEDVYPSNPTKYPGAKVTVVLKAEDGGRFVASAFLEPDQIEGSNIRIRSAVGSDDGESGLRLSPIPGLYDDPKGRRFADVVCEKGRPDHANDFDDGQLQYIYDGGKLVLYVDKRTQMVTGVQRFGID